MDIFLTATAIVLAYMTCIFCMAQARKDNSIVDIAYGGAFVLASGACWLLYGSCHPRTFLVLVLVTLWGVRLAAHIFVRHQGRGEDFRYRKWRQEWGKTFVWRSFLQIFMLQGLVVIVVATPILLVIRRPGGPLGLLDYLGVVVWSLGFFFEAVGDWQLLRFKKDPANKGRVMQYGLWRYTRHPNYFGEATLWWGIFLIALQVPAGGWAIISPLTIDFLLLKVSGIPMLEIKYEGNPEFEAYKKRTNALLPWFPHKTSP